MRRNRKPICGVGINDADYNVQVRDSNRKILFACEYYAKWVDMIIRCYSEDSQRKSKTYEGCTVCEEWLVFSNFKSWLEKQGDFTNLALDKDILKEGNKVYSPDACLLVTKEVNSSLVLRGRDRGDYPVGVHKRESGRFVARCQEGKERLWIGTYDTPEEAHKAWQVVKLKRFKTLQEKQTDSRVIKGLQRIIDKLQYHIDNNIETKDL